MASLIIRDQYNSEVCRVVVYCRRAHVVGHFGCVFRGILKVPEQKTELEVAVKTLRSFTGQYTLDRHRQPITKRPPNSLPQKTDVI